MSKLLLSTMLLMFMTLDSYCQKQKCNINREVNEYTGSTTIKTEQVKLVSSFAVMKAKQPWNIRTLFIVENDTISMYFIHGSQGMSASMIRFIYFKFEDGSVLKMTEPLDGGSYDNGDYIFKYTVFNLSKDELKKFASIEIQKCYLEFMRYIEEPTVDKELKKNTAVVIKRDANCLINEL